LAEALHGYSSEHFRWLLKQLIDELARLDRKLNEIDVRIREQMQPHQDLVCLLCHEFRAFTANCLHHQKSADPGSAAWETNARSPMQMPRTRVRLQTRKNTTTSEY
jgi:hypothetical protein